MAKAFEVKGLYKSFGDVKALNGINLSAEEGKIFGLLGPNGAGKTVTVRTLTTLLQPDKGTAEVLGIDVVKDPDSVRKTIGLAGQYAAVDAFQTGYENVYMTGLLYGLKRKEAKKRTVELLEKLNLTSAAGRQVKTYSGGMRRRLDLGASLIGRPKVLFLDEPTTGLDPQSRLDIWALVRELVAEGTSIVLTTQYLEEADELADMIAIINHGKVIAEGTSDQLKTKFGGDVVEFELQTEADKSRAMDAVKVISRAKVTYNEDDKRVTVPIKDGSKDLMKIVQALNSAKLEVEALSLHRPSLDDVFLSLTGDKIKVDESAGQKKKGRRG